MSRAFSNTINTKSDNPLYNRIMVNYNENPTFTQFNSNSNQLNNSLQLLSNTADLIIQPHNLPTFDNFIPDREPSLNFSMSKLNIENPTTLPNQTNNQLDLLINKQSIKHDIPSFSEFVIKRDPALDFGIHGLPIQNPTTLPKQNNNQLDLSTQLEIPNTLKNTNPSTKMISTNDITEPLNKYQGISQPHIPYEEYTKPTAYFNNFHNNGRSEIIKEYITHINSIDRDIIKYPSPFNFLVRCAPLANDLNASISRTFENIRYIKLETAILPLKYYLNQTNITSNTIIDTPNYLPLVIKNLFNSPLVEPNTVIIDNLENTDLKWIIIYAKSYVNLQYTNTNIYSEEYNKYKDNIVISYTQLIPDYATKMSICYECIYNPSTNTYTTFKYELSNLSIADDKYTIMYLNDINDVSNYSTNKILSNAFNVLYPDLIECNSLYIDCNYVEKIYKYSSLGNVERMLINLTNSMGKQLTTNIIAQDNKLSNFDSTICTCSINSNGSIIRDYKCICSYIRHPRYISHQVNFMFKFGIIETDMNIRAFN